MHIILGPNEGQLRLYLWGTVYLPLLFPISCNFTISKFLSCLVMRTEKCLIASMFLMFFFFFLIIYKPCWYSRGMKSFLQYFGLKLEHKYKKKTKLVLLPFSEFVIFYGNWYISFSSHTKVSWLPESPLSWANTICNHICKVIL